jgi:hypothetical protein
MLVSFQELGGQGRIMSSEEYASLPARDQVHRHRAGQVMDLDTTVAVPKRLLKTRCSVSTADAITNVTYQGTIKSTITYSHIIA